MRKCYRDAGFLQVRRSAAVRWLLRDHISARQLGGILVRVFQTNWDLLIQIHNRPIGYGYGYSDFQDANKQAKFLAHYRPDPDPDPPNNYGSGSGRPITYVSYRVKPLLGRIVNSQEYSQHKAIFVTVWFPWTQNLAGFETWILKRKISAKINLNFAIGYVI